MHESFEPTLANVLAGVTTRQTLDVQHKFVYELGWRADFRHVWQHPGDGILQSLHEGPLPDEAYARELPADIRQACTGVPVVDKAVRRSGRSARPRLHCVRGSIGVATPSRHGGPASRAA